MHYLLVYDIHSEYNMLISVSQAVSTRPKATSPPGDIGLGLIQHGIQILTCHVHYIMYFLNISSVVCEGACGPWVDIGVSG